MTTNTLNHRGWYWLLLASVFEIIWALSTKASMGYTVLVPSLISAVTAITGVFLLGQALKTLAVSVGYTVWVAIGAVGSFILGALMFDEPFTLAKIICFILIIGGVIGLHADDRAADPDQVPPSSEQKT